MPDAERAFRSLDLHIEHDRVRVCCIFCHTEWWELQINSKPTGKNHCGCPWYKQIIEQRITLEQAFQDSSYLFPDRRK